MFKVIYLLKDHLLDYKRGYISGIFFLLIATTISLIPPQLISYFINQITDSTLTESSFILIILIMVSSIVLGYIVGFLWIYLIYISGQFYDRNKRINIHSKILSVNNNFFFKFPVGDVITRLTSDLKNVTLAASDGIYFTVEAISSLILLVIVMSVTTNFIMTLIVLIPLLLLSFVTNKISDIVTKRYNLVQESTSLFATKVLQTVVGIRIVNGFNMQNKTNEMLNESSNNIYLKSIRLDRVDSLIGAIYRTFYGVIYSFSILYGLYLVVNQEITVGQLVAFNLYIGMLEWPIYALQLVFGVLQRGHTSIKRINQLENYQALQQKNGDVIIDDIKEIYFNRFSFIYQDIKALDNVDLKILKYTNIGIVGKIGSGKSTLIKQLLNLYEYSNNGHIFINNVDLSKIEKVSYLRHISYVSQESYSFSMSIKDNILIGNDNACDEDIVRVLKHACLYDDIVKLPEGIDTIVSEKGISLSGGQQQRLSLARALIKESSILILDDILSALDLETESKIIRNLNMFYSNHTIIIISHRMSCIVGCDNIIVMDEGRIVEQGNHHSLVSLDGWYARQIKLQTKHGDYYD